MCCLASLNKSHASTGIVDICASLTIDTMQRQWYVKNVWYVERPYPTHAQHYKSIWEKSCIWLALSCSNYVTYVADLYGVWLPLCLVAAEILIWLRFTIFLLCWIVIYEYMRCPTLEYIVTSPFVSFSPSPSCVLYMSRFHILVLHINVYKLRTYVYFSTTAPLRARSYGKQSRS